MILSNEFASVEVELDESAHGPRLRVTDLLHGGGRVHLDPMQLEGLVWAGQDELARLSEPDRILAGVERRSEGGPR